MRLAAALMALLMLAACRHEELVIEPPPKIVRVPVYVPVSLCPEGGADCDLLRDCIDEAAKEQTYNEAKRVANLRHASIDECNKRWKKVRALQPKSAADRGN